MREMLPACLRGDRAVGKYADTAIPALLALIARSGGSPSRVQATLVGGAQMFAQGDAKIASIGEQNVRAARRILAERGTPVEHEEGRLSDVR